MTFSGTINVIEMRSLEEILKFVDTFNRNIYRIYYHLYLSNNFNYCAI